MTLEKYLSTNLISLLQSYGIKSRFMKPIVYDIRNRMISLLRKDLNDRNTILFTTLEEAIFYEPEADLLIKEFVIATIRNSMLEIIASDNCRQLGLEQPISNLSIKELTGDAIIYFSKCDFNDLLEEVTSLEYKDIYGEAITMYPIGWGALKHLALCEETNEFQQKKMFTNDESEIIFDNCKDMNFSVCDGYSLEFDDNLNTLLGDIVAGRQDIFYTDAFKSLTRNFQKLLNVLELVLKADKICNIKLLYK